MTQFTSRDPAATKILSEELERKISEVNSHMVETREKAEKFQEKVNKLEIDVRDLENKKGKLLGDIAGLVEQKNTSDNEIAKLNESIDYLKTAVSDLDGKLKELKNANKEEATSLSSEREEIAKKKSDIDGQEAVLRTVAKGLEEKEKKLDIYADRVKRLLDSVKPE